MTTLQTRDKRGRRVVILDCDVPDDPREEIERQWEEMKREAGYKG